MGRIFHMMAFNKSVDGCFWQLESAYFYFIGHFVALENLWLSGLPEAVPNTKSERICFWLLNAD